MSKKKILLISDHADPLAQLGGEQAGGQNNYVRQLALALENVGYRVDVVTHWNDSASSQQEAFSAFCQVIRIAAGYREFLSKDAMYDVLPAFYEEMTATLSLRSYSLIHTNYWLSGLLGEKLQREYNIPFVHTSHSLAKAKQIGTGQFDPRRFTAEQQILRATRAIIATSQYEKDLIQSFEPNSAPIHVIPCGVNEVFTSDNRRQQCSIQKGTTFLFAGRLVEEKGIFTLLTAFRSLIERSGKRSNIRLIIAGGEKTSVDLQSHRPLDPLLKQYTQGLEDAVSFVGPQSQESLARLFHKVSATIVPSYYESFGMVAAESLACGTPVIASRAGGLQHVVTQGKTGLLVEPKNADQLVSVMDRLAKNKHLRRTLGKNAIRVVEKHFRWNVLINQIDKLYREVGGFAKN